MAGIKIDSRIIGAFVAAATLGAMLWTAASAWGTLQQRVNDLERRQQFEHGNYDLPKGR